MIQVSSLTISENQVVLEIESLMKRTLPSPRQTLTPPGCKLRACPPLLLRPLVDLRSSPGPVLQGMPMAARLGTRCQVKRQVCSSSPPSSPGGGAGPVHGSWGSGCTAWSRSTRLAPAMPIAQVPRMSMVATPERISAKNAVFDVPSVMAAQRDSEVHAHHPSLRRPFERCVRGPLIAVDRVVAVGAALDRTVVPAPSSPVAHRCGIGRE